MVREQQHVEVGTTHQSVARDVLLAECTAVWAPRWVPADLTVQSWEVVLEDPARYRITWGGPSLRGVVAEVHDRGACVAAPREGPSQRLINAPYPTQLHIARGVQTAEVVVAEATCLHVICTALGSMEIHRLLRSVARLDRPW